MIGERGVAWRIVGATLYWALLPVWGPAFVVGWVLSVLLDYSVGRIADDDVRRDTLTEP